MSEEWRKLHIAICCLKLGNRKVCKSIQDHGPSLPTNGAQGEGNKFSQRDESQLWTAEIAKQMPGIQAARQPISLYTRGKAQCSNKGKQKSSSRWKMMIFLVSRFSIHSCPFVNTQQCSGPATTQPALGNKVFPSIERLETSNVRNLYLIDLCYWHSIALQKRSTEFSLFIMLTTWSSSFFLKRKRKVVGREIKKSSKEKTKG